MFITGVGTSKILEFQWNSKSLGNQRFLEKVGIPLELEFHYQWFTFSSRFPSPIPIPIFGFQSFPNPNPNLSQKFLDFQFQLISQLFQLICFPTPNLVGTKWVPIFYAKFKRATVSEVCLPQYNQIIFFIRQPVS